MLDFCSVVAATIGYQVHAIDVLPFCTMHVKSNAHENGFVERIHAHNIGLSATEGALIQVPFINSKVGTSFHVSNDTPKDDLTNNNFNNRNNSSRPQTLALAILL